MIAFINGVSLSASLVVSIGPQNTELLRLGLLKKENFTLASVYCICEVFLVSLGIIGAGALFSSSKSLMKICLFCAAILLYYYGLCAFKRIFNVTPQFVVPNVTNTSRVKVIKSGLVLSLLNPLAVLDTVIIIGSISSQYSTQNDKLLFGSGAIIMALIWFYGIAFLSGRFSQLFKLPSAQRFLEGFVALVMWVTALILTFRFFD